MNFFEETLISGSKNGLIVLWNLCNDSVTRLPQYTDKSVVRIEVVNEKTFLVVTSEFRVFIFQKTRNKVSSGLVSMHFECEVVVNLRLDSKIDRVISSCKVMKSLWLGTEKGRLLVVDFKQFFEANDLRLQDFYLDISGDN